MPGSYLQTLLQKQIGSQTFPANREDWYVKNGFGDSEMSLEERFAVFEQAQRQPEGQYNDALKGINLERYQIDVTLANKSQCGIEVVAFHNDIVNSSSASTSTSPTANEQGKHVIYFTGMGTLYQHCFIDIATAVRTTGTSYYGFEYPGMSQLGGQVSEVNDLVNTGLALTNHLLRQGIPIDSIIFQGDSFGAAVAKKISDEFKEQSGVEIRCILNNTFSSLQEAVQGLLNQSYLTASLKPAVAPVLRYIGWAINTGENYQVTPYQVHVNHIGDGLLGPGNATLAAWVERNREQPDFIDICPEEFREHRNTYSTLHWAEIGTEGEEYLATKYGRNTQGEVNTHLANLNYLQYSNGQSVYEALVSPYIQASNQYVANHPQKLSLDNLPQPLESEQASLGSLIYSVLPHVPSIPRFLSFFNRTPTVATDVVEQELEKDNPQPKI